MAGFLDHDVKSHICAAFRDAGDCDSRRLHGSLGFSLLTFNFSLLTSYSLLELCAG